MPTEPPLKLFTPTDIPISPCVLPVAVAPKSPTGIVIPSSSPWYGSQSTGTPGHRSGVGSKPMCQSTFVMLPPPPDAFQLRSNSEYLWSPGDAALPAPKGFWFEVSSVPLFVTVSVAGGAAEEAGASTHAATNASIAAAQASAVREGPVSGVVHGNLPGNSGKTS